MSNNFYNASNAPATGSSLSSATQRAEFAAIEDGFDKLPTLTANGDEVVVINTAANALTSKPRADIVAEATTGASSKTPPVDADEIPLADSAASFSLKKLTWANLKAAIKDYYDSVTSTMTNKTLTSPVISGATTLTASSASAALTVTQTGAGNSFVVEDAASPDSSPYAIDAFGRVVAGNTAVITGSTITPQQQLLGTTSGTSSKLQATFSATSTDNPFIQLAKSANASVGSHSAVISGESLGTINFAGSDGTGFIRAVAIQGYVDGTPGTNDMPGRLVFSTTADGAASPTERVRIDSTGRVGIGAAPSVGGVSLTVVGGGVQLSGGTTSQEGLRIQRASGYASITGINNDNNAYNALAFFTSATEAMRIDTSGNASMAGTLAMGSAYTFRNKIINGGFDVWQRGTSGAGGLDAPRAYTAADRWYGLRGAFASGLTMSRVAGTTAQYACKVQRDAANAATNLMYLAQPFETSTIAPLRGKTVTLSVTLKAGANYSGGVVSVLLVTGTGTEGKYIAASFTGAALAINATQAITTTATRYTFTSTAIPSNATQMELVFSFTPTGTAGADDSVTFENVQLEEGSAATPFEYRPIPVELAMCQRYCQVFGLDAANNVYVCTATANAATTGYAFYQPKVNFRGSVALAYSAIGDLQLYNGSGFTALTNISVTYNNPGSLWFGLGVASGLTAGAFYQLHVNSGAAKYLYVTSEL